MTIVQSDEVYSFTEIASNIHCEVIKDRLIKSFDIDPLIDSLTLKPQQMPNLSILQKTSQISTEHLKVHDD